MKKIKIILIVVLIIAATTQVTAKQTDTISFNSIKDILYANSSALKKIDIGKKQLDLEYKNAQNDSKRAGNTLDSLKENSYTKKMINANLRSIFAIQMELMPKVMENEVYKLDKKEEVTKRTLEISLREIYAGCLNYYNDSNIKTEKLKIENRKYSQNKLKYENGLISNIDLKESEYNLNKAKTELEVSKRNFTNMIRNFSSFLGVEVGEDFSKYIVKEDQNNIAITGIDTYIKYALEENADTKAIEKDIEVKKLSIDIDEREDSFNSSITRQKSYRDTQRVLEKLNVQLENKKYEVETNIKQAYIEVMKERDNIETLNKNISILETKLSKYTAQYEQGFLTKTIIDDVSIGLTELKNTLNVATFSYNTKVLKLYYAAGIGPLY